MLSITWILNRQLVDNAFYDSTPYTITNPGTVTNTLGANITVGIEHAGQYTCIGSLQSGSIANGTNIIGLQCK